MSALPLPQADTTSISSANPGRRVLVWLSALGWTGWVLIAILLGAAALRLYHLGTPGLWLDELGQAMVAQRPLLDLLDGVRRHHGAAPLDYLITALMVRTSNGEGVLRFPAAVWGLLSVYWLFRLGRRWHSPAAGLIAAALLAASAFHLRYSQELRFYSLFVFLTLSSAEALAVAWSSGRLRAWLLYGALAMLMLYAHYYATLMIVFQAVWVLLLWLEGRGRSPQTLARRQIVSFVAVTAAAAVVFLPWLFYDIVREGGLPGETTPTLEWGVVETTLLAFGGEFWPWWALLAVCGLAAQWRRSRANAVFLALWVLVSLPLVVLSDQARSYFFHIRQMIIVLPPFLLLVSVGLCALAGGAAQVVQNRWGEKAAIIVRRVLLLTTTAALLALSWPRITTYFVDQERYEDWRSLGELLSDNLSLDDSVVAWGVERYLAFYSPRAVQQTHDLASLVELEALHATGKPLWLLVTPYLEQRRDLAAEVQSWIDRQSAIVFDLGAGFRLYYLQANRDREALWQTAQYFDLPTSRSDLWLSYTRELGTLDTEAALITLAAAAERTQDVAVRAGLLLRAGNVALRRRDYARANELFDQTLAAQPDLAEAYLRKGYALLELGQPQAALNALTTAHETFGRDDYWVHRWLGIALSRLNRPAEAVPHFLAAIERSPDAHEVRFLAGAAYAKLGDNSAAQQWLRDYLAREPGGVWAQEAERLLATLGS